MDDIWVIVLWACLFCGFKQNVYEHSVHDLYDAICYFLVK